MPSAVSFGTAPLTAEIPAAGCVTSRKRPGPTSELLKCLVAVIYPIINSTPGAGTTDYITKLIKLKWFRGAKRARRQLGLDAKPENRKLSCGVFFLLDALEEEMFTATVLNFISVKELNSTQADDYTDRQLIYSC